MTTSIRAVYAAENNTVCYNIFILYIHYLFKGTVCWHIICQALVFWCLTGTLESPEQIAAPGKSTQYCRHISYKLNINVFFIPFHDSRCHEMFCIWPLISVCHAHGLLGSLQFSSCSCPDAIFTFASASSDLPLWIVALCSRKHWKDVQEGMALTVGRTAVPVSR